MPSLKHATVIRQVFNPATNEEITRVADCTHEDVDKAVKAASKAFETFSQTSAKERSVLLRKLYDLHNVHQKVRTVILDSRISYGGHYPQLIKCRKLSNGSFNQKFHSPCY